MLADELAKRGARLHEVDPEVAKHSRHYGGGGWRRGREDTRVTGMCREGERAPVSQEEEEAGWTRTLLST